MVKISVITTFYNPSGFIKEAVDSVTNQSFKDYEHIVVDDGSTDKSISFINTSDSRIKIYEPGRIGRARALNFAIEKSIGEYIAILDADDTYEINKLDIQNKILDERDDISLVYSNAKFINLSGENIGISSFPNTHEEIKNSLINLNPFPASTAMFRRKDWDEVGGYIIRCKKSLDYNLYLSLLLRGKKFYGVKEAISRTRLSSKSWGKNDTESLQFKFGIIGLINFYIQNKLRCSSIYDFTDKEWNEFLNIFNEWFFFKKFSKKKLSKDKFNESRLAIRNGKLGIFLIKLYESLILDPYVFFYRGIGFKYEQDILEFLMYFDKEYYENL